MADAIAHGQLFLPDEINLSEDWLTWKIPPVSHSANWVRCTDRTLEKFTRLESASDILSFARRYGVLGAKEIKPDAPRHPNELRLQPTSGRWCVSMRSGVAPAEREPLWIWFLLIQQARGILRICAALKGRARDPKPAIGTEEDWRAVAGPGGPPIADVIDAQLWLSIAVNEWLRIGQVGFQLGLAKVARMRANWTVQVGFGDGEYNLFGQLAYQMFLNVAGEKLYVCSSCIHPYIREKKAPRAGQDNYCPDCTPIAQARAMQRFREKQKKAKRKTR